MRSLETEALYFPIDQEEGEQCPLIPMSFSPWMKETSWGLRKCLELPAHSVLGHFMAEQGQFKSCGALSMKHKADITSGSNWFRWVPTSSKWFKPLLSYSWFRPVPTDANRFQGVQTISNQFQQVLTSSDQFKSVQTGYEQFWAVPTSSNRFQTVDTGSDWLWLVQTNSEPVGTIWYQFE